MTTNLTGMNGRVYLIVLDDLHTNCAADAAGARRRPASSSSATSAPTIWWRSCTPADAADAGQEFTTNPRLMLAAVDRFMGRKVRSSTLNRIDEEYRTRQTRQQGDRIDDIDNMERGYQARISLDSMRQVSQFLGGVSGRRKALVLFSEGIDYDINDVFNNRDATTILDSTRGSDRGRDARQRRRSTASTRADWVAWRSKASRSQSFPTDTTLGIGSTSFQDELRLSQDSLRVLSSETGGFAIVNTNDFGTAFQRIVDDNSSYYVLGYYPTNERRDGRFRKIEVKVPGRPEARIRARKGYVAARGRAAGDQAGRPERSHARTAERDEQPAAALRAADGGDGGRVQGSAAERLGRGVDADWRRRRCRSSRRTATSATTWSWRWWRSTRAGKTFSGGRNTLDLNMKPDTAKRAAAFGFRVISTIDLPPGRYVLRVGARESNTKKAGSVSYDLEVPDFAQGAAADEQPGAHLGGQLRRADGPFERPAATAAAGPAVDASRVPAGRRGGALRRGLRQQRGPAAQGEHPRLAQGRGRDSRSSRPARSVTAAS